MAHQGIRHQLLALLAVVRSFEHGMSGIKPARHAMRIGTARVNRLLLALEGASLVRRGSGGAWIARWYEDADEFEARLATATELHG